MDENPDVLRLIETFEKDENLTPQEAAPFRSDRRFNAANLSWRLSI